MQSPLSVKWEKICESRYFSFNLMRAVITQTRLLLSAVLNLVADPRLCEHVTYFVQEKKILLWPMPRADSIIELMWIYNDIYANIIIYNDDDFIHSSSKSSQAFLCIQIKRRINSQMLTYVGVDFISFYHYYPLASFQSTHDDHRVPPPLC